MSFLSKLRRTFENVVGIAPKAPSSQGAATAAGQRKHSPQATFEQCADNVADGQIFPADQSLADTVRSRQDIDGVFGGQILDTDQRVTDTVPTQQTLRHSFANVVASRMMTSYQQVTDTVRSQQQPLQPSLRQRRGNDVDDHNASVGADENGSVVVNANPKLHAVLFLRWLRQHQWPERREIVTEREAELSYTEFCMDQFLQPVSWRAVARHFSHITRSPSGSLRPCRFIRDPGDGAFKRVRIYIVTSSPTSAEREAEAELGLAPSEAPRRASGGRRS
jgi:hypothetical protein